MKRTLILSGAICALLTAVVFAFGDIARPKAPVAGKTVLYTAITVVPDANATEARLQISADTLKHIQDSYGRDGGGTESLSQRVMHSSTRTIMAGLFMFLAVSFAGVWFARSSQRRHNRSVAAALLVAIGFSLATVIVRANAGPPGYVRWANLPQALKDGKATNGGVEIEIVPGDDYLKLIVPLRKTVKPGEE
jgi:hypothetical protein